MFLVSGLIAVLYIFFKSTHIDVVVSSSHFHNMHLLAKLIPRLKFYQQLRGTTISNRRIIIHIPQHIFIFFPRHTPISNCKKDSLNLHLFFFGKGERFL
ncbi:hypothetical protein AQUCO_34600001v1 [Aquilegia coerulea]|uniref:Uncharacterized protein n=1 Tax=Aquilegia coerulea TaxID=218851 RepID=A0A2G5C0G4_AQUCA|nr:hypothetical protein AQUCO_34600001v1 [Aquilegia coerulea]